MNKIPFSNIYDGIKEIMPEIMSKIENIINNTDFIGGKEIEEFEKEFANFCGTNYAIGCSNGTDALEIALKALGIGKGDTVLVPVNTFIATAEAVTNVGVNVDFIDIEEDYYNIDPEKIVEYLEKNKNKNVKAIIPVHLYGQIANMNAIIDISKKYNLRIIEDAAQAHGAEYYNKRAGSFGDIATYSFYPGKNLGAFGDAGAIVTNNKELYEKAKMLINHGRKPGAKYEHEIIGGNKRLDNLQAAILRIKLKYLEKWNEMRRNKIKLYLEYLKNNDNIILPKIRENSNPCWHLFVIRVKERDKIIKRLKENNISYGIHYPYPLHLLKAYEFLGYKEGSFKIAEKISKEIISLPFWPEISEEEIEKIANCLNL